jgi:aminoglycoside/choline kinase family phosphotransferase
MERTQLLENWIKDQFPEKVFTLKPASADASFRRYFRVFIDDRTFVVMDAPPQHEDCRPFLQVADILSATGVHVPKILAQNLEHGFLLLSDLGNTTFLQALTSDTARVDQLYADAIDALIQMQLSQRTEGLPDYDETLLLRELNLFPDWYIAKHLGKALSDQQTVMLSTIFARILANNLAQPKVLVHRDYHSRNLMVSTPNPGIIDFQDAVVGPDHL